ncbi:MAG: PqqD family protein [Chloroflexi bacterium]|nr:MAG: PqqD family protein [Chloroflexota bacterium]
MRSLPSFFGRSRSRHLTTCGRVSWPGVTRSCHSGEVNRDSKVSRNPKIVARELGAPQGAVLLHLETGAYHGLNPVGFVVWELIDDRRTVADLVDGVRDRIKNAPPEVDQDVMKFLEAALARDLILVE